MIFYSEKYLQKKILQNIIPRDLSDNFYHPNRNLDVTFKLFYHLSKIDFAEEITKNELSTCC